MKLRLFRGILQVFSLCSGGLLPSDCIKYENTYSEGLDEYIFNEMRCLKVLIFGHRRR